MDDLNLSRAQLHAEFINLLSDLDPFVTLEFADEASVCPNCDEFVDDDHICSEAPPSFEMPAWEASVFSGGNA